MKDTIQEVSKFLTKKYNGVVESIRTVAKEDLELVSIAISAMSTISSMLIFLLTN